MVLLLFLFIHQKWYFILFVAGGHPKWRTLYSLINFVNELLVFFLFTFFFVIQIDELNITHFQSTQMLSFLSLALSHTHSLRALWLYFRFAMCEFNQLFRVCFGKAAVETVSLLKCQMYCWAARTCTFFLHLCFFCFCSFFPQLKISSFAILSVTPAHRTTHTHTHTYFVLLNGNDFGWGLRRKIVYSLMPWRSLMSLSSLS